MPCHTLFILEAPAGIGHKIADSRFLDGGVFLVEFALDGPIIPCIGFGHQVNPQIRSAKVFSEREFVPQPYFFNILFVKRRCFQEMLHQYFKALPLFPFIPGHFAIGFKD